MRGRARTLAGCCGRADAPAGQSKNGDARRGAVPRRFAYGPPGVPVCRRLVRPVGPVAPPAPRPTPRRYPLRLTPRGACQCALFRNARPGVRAGAGPGARGVAALTPPRPLCPRPPAPPPRSARKFSSPTLKLYGQLTRRVDPELVAGFKVRSRFIVLVLADPERFHRELRRASERSAARRDTLRIARFLAWRWRTGWTTTTPVSEHSAIGNLPQTIIR